MMMMMVGGGGRHTNPSPTVGCEHLQGRHRHTAGLFTEAPQEGVSLPSLEATNGR